MKHLSRYAQKAAAVFLVILLVLLSSCNKTGSEPDIEEPAPEIPPLETMLIDFADFDNSLAKNGATTTRENWGWAALNLGIWNTIITLNLAVPVAAFLHSFSHDAVPNPDGNGWLWSYDYTALGRNYTANLTAQPIGNGIRWEMRISQQNGYQDFLWFYGESNILLREGFWRLSNNPNDPVEYLQIDWTRDPENSAANVRYTVITPGGAENGTYIEYGINQDTPYNAYYDIFSVTQNNLREIEWHRTTKEGHIRDERHFGDTDWHCWSSTLDDITCP